MNIDSDRPLCDKTIIFTRAQSQQGEAHQLLNSLGARVLDLPALVIGPPKEWTPLDKALSEIDSFDWLIFSSYNGVVAVEERLNLIGKSLAASQKDFEGLKIAAVGRKTAKKLNELGARTDFVPPDFIADSLIQNFPEAGLGKRVLLPRVQSGGRVILTESLTKARMEVVEVAAYESFCPEEMPEDTAKALRNSKVDAIAFTSGKTVLHTSYLLRRRFGNDYKKILKTLKIFSIGPQTTLACKKYLERIDAEANPHDLEGMIHICVQSLSNTSHMS